MRASRRYLVVTLFPMTVLFVGSTLWAVLLFPAVPDPMAVHFDAQGAADDYMAPATNLALTVGIQLLIIVGFAVFARMGMWHGSTGRIIAGSAGFGVALIALLQIEIFRRQSGLDDATSAVLPFGAIAGIVGIASIIGLLLGWVPSPVPVSPAPTQPVDRDLQDADLPETWTRTESMHGGIQALLLGVVIFTIAFAVYLPNWATVGTAVVTTLAILATWGWRLCIDATGVSYASFLGWPRRHLPYEVIADAEVVDIKAGAWGGWGWRKNSSGTGLITQSGRGLRLTLTDGKIVDISTEEASAAVRVIARHRRRNSDQKA